MNGLKIELNLVNKAIEDAQGALNFEDIFGYPQMPMKTLKMYEYYSRDFLEQLQKTSSQSNS